MTSKLDFLTSVSFWCGFVIAVANYLCSQGLLTQDIVTFITTVLGFIVGVRVKNQFSEAVKTEVVKTSDC